VIVLFAPAAFAFSINVDLRHLLFECCQLVGKERLERSFDRDSFLEFDRSPEQVDRKRNAAQVAKVLEHAPYAADALHVGMVRHRSQLAVFFIALYVHPHVHKG